VKSASDLIAPIVTLGFGRSDFEQKRLIGLDSRYRGAEHHRRTAQHFQFQSDRLAKIEFSARRSLKKFSPYTPCTLI
jgi:hypothetical protein